MNHHLLMISITKNFKINAFMIETKSFLMENKVF